MASHVLWGGAENFQLSTSGKPGTSRASPAKNRLIRVAPRLRTGILAEMNPTQKQFSLNRAASQKPIPIISLRIKDGALLPWRLLSTVLGVGLFLAAGLHAPAQSSSAITATAEPLGPSSRRTP